MMSLTKKKGFALVAVLGLVSVLMLLLGALIGTNQSTFSLLRFSQSKHRMDRTIASVFAYSQYQLEHDYRWGRSAFQGDVQNHDGLQLTEIADGSTPPSHIQTLVGTDQANGTRFVVEVCNNLTGEVALISDTQSGHRDGVPVGFCRLNITVESNQKFEGATILVRNPGLVGASLLANGDLNLEVQDFQMMTKDPIKNQARSMGDSGLTGMQDFFFSGPPPNPAGNGVDNENPIIWSGGDTQFRLDEGSSFQDRQAFKASNSSQDLRDERFVDQAKTLFEIPDVELQHIADVTHPDGSSKSVRQIPSGIYEFQQHTVGGTLVRVLARRTTDTSTPLRDQSGTIDRFWYAADNGSIPAGTVASVIGAPAGATSTNAGGSQYATLDVEGAMVDLLQRRIVMDDQYNYEVDGDFGIRSGGSLADRIKPSLFFADPGDLGDGRINFQYNDDAAAAEQEGRIDDRGSLRATGQIQLDGDISGSATIAGGGHVSLAPTRFYDGNGNTEVDFSIFSGGDISLVPPNLIEGKDNRDGDASDIARTITLDDGTIFNIEHSNISQNELVFTGLLYAQGSVSFDLRDTLQETQQRDLSIEGAVVARSGDLRVENSNRFAITYNPQYVDRLLPSLFQNGQHRIEVTGWRSWTPTSFSASAP